MVFMFFMRIPQKKVPENCLVLYTYSVKLGFSKYVKRKNRNVVRVVKGSSLKHCDFYIYTWFNLKDTEF